MDKFDRALARSVVQHRCFRCDGVLVVLHLCPCCSQLVHPGCECPGVLKTQQVVQSASGNGLLVQQEEEA